MVVTEGEEEEELSGIRKVVYEVLKSFGAVLERGTLAVSELFADTIVVKNADIREAVLGKASVGDLSVENSLQMTDQRTGKTFCMVLVDGALVPQEGTCDTLSISAGSDAPVIEIVGNNPANIELGATYNDLGVNISDDKDTNLGVELFLDGSSVSDIAIDTASSTEYVITYRVTDTDGNVSETDRVVVVGDGAEEVIEEPVEEPVEESVEEETSTTTEEVLPEEVVEDESDTQEEIVEEVVEEVVEDTLEEVIEETPEEEVIEVTTEEIAVEDVEPVAAGEADAAASEALTTDESGEVTSNDEENQEA